MLVSKNIDPKFVINPETGTEPKGPTRGVDNTEQDRIHSAALRRQHEDRMKAKAPNEDCGARMNNDDLSRSIFGQAVRTKVIVFLIELFVGSIFLCMVIVGNI
jgi:hypothetical protein